MRMNTNSVCRSMTFNSDRVMYVEMTKGLKVNLMGMDFTEAVALQHMIEGASLEERRQFNGILRQLKQLLIAPYNWTDNP